MLLSADRKRDRRDLTVGTVRVPAVPARRTKTVRSTVTIAAKPGSYHLLVCARTCKVAMLRVEAKPAPGGGGAPAPQPAPGPQPSATPGATATPEATATPVATPTATPTSTATPGPTPDAPDETELPSGFGDSVEFLYSGPNKVQTGVAAGTIKAARVAVLRGSVHGRDGQGLGGVAVTVLDHPELGRTVTRADGGYDLAVNGGGPLTIEFARAGFVAAQREVVAPWQDFAAVEDVVLVAYDARVTRIDLDAGAAQVAAGNPVTDGDGTRQASVVFKAGTKAEMVLPDGTVKPLDELDVRATEFTAGASGPDAMPGSLPPSSGYTYAAELSVDQAVAAGATEVRFDKPVINYVDNFLGFPVGGIVPTGYYDRADGEWKAAPNGRVIKLLAVVDGKAQLDTDGDGQADDGLNIDDAERARLAETRHVGDELWRVPMDHFTPWDHNWPYAPDPDAVPPSPPEPRADVPANRRQAECNKAGSIIGCQSQSLAEELAVTGTPLKLRYDTRRAGRRTDRSIEIPLTGRKIPQSLEQVRLEVSVAGRTERKTFAPKADLVYEYVWDRRDAYGREVQGRQPVTIRIGFEYGLRRYSSPGAFDAAFGKFSGFEGEVIGERRDESTKYVSWRTVRDEFGIAVGSLDARGTGLGGWEIDAHHAYDARMRTLYRGDGQEISAERVLDTLAGTGHAGDPRDTDVAPDGQVWVADAATDRVLRVNRDGDGDVETMAGSVGGGGCENCKARVSNATTADDPPAKGFSLARPMAVALAPDGGFYIADYMVDWGLQQGVIYRVDPAGRIHKIAGCLCNTNALGDGGSALQTAMTPLDLAVGRDGTLYVADYRNNRIRAIDADGTIRTVAGGGPEAGGYDDGINGLQARLWEPHSVETGPDGEVYFADDGKFSRVRRLDPDGTVTTVAGGRPLNADDNGDGGPATAANLHTNPQGLALGADGSLYLADFAQIRRVATDGTITTVAGGGGDSAKNADRVPVGSVRFDGAMGVDVAPDGSLYIVSSSGLSRVSRPFPTTTGGELAVPSKDGAEVYFFDAGGRHLRTQDGVTGVTLWRFAYDDAGRMASITDADDRVTRIERDGGGNADGDRRPRRPADGARGRRPGPPAQGRRPGRRGHQAQLRRRRAAVGADRPPQRPPRVRLRRVRPPDPRRGPDGQGPDALAHGDRRRLRRHPDEPGGPQAHVGGRRAPQRRRLPRVHRTVGRQDHVLGRDRRRAPPAVRDGRDDRGHPGPGPALGLLRPGPAQARPPLAERAHADDHGDPHRHAGRRHRPAVAEDDHRHGHHQRPHVGAQLRRRRAPGDRHVAGRTDREDGLRRQGPPRHVRARPGRRADHLHVRRPAACSGAPSRAAGSPRGSTTSATARRSARTTPAGARS